MEEKVTEIKRETGISIFDGIFKMAKATGALNRPDLAERYLKVERESGFLFREKRSLQQILHPQVDEDDLFAWVEKAAV